MMFDAADLAAFVDPAMPGYVQALINGQPVGGLFRDRYAEGFGFVVGAPCTLRVLDTVLVSENDAVVIGAAHYNVAAIENAEPGFNLIRLESA